MKRLMAHKTLQQMAVLEQLRTYGIKLKHWNCKHQTPDGGKHGATHIVLEGTKTFGTPLYALPKSFVQEYGNIPVFLIEACKYLEEHAEIEGLFRKSGSIVRLKALKSKLDHGDRCLATAAPCDVAGLLKQFFRELPEPILQPDLHEAFLKAQQLGGEDERSTATLLLSCLLPDTNIETLRFFFSFLHNVARRSDENKMNSSNLAVIFAPNLLQSSDGHERMSANTEKRLRLQAALVRTLIDHAAEIGSIPEVLWQRIQALLGVDMHCGTPSLEGNEEGKYGVPGEHKRCRRRSLGAFSSMMTPVIPTPSKKRKLPLDCSQGFSSKKLNSLMHNLTFDLPPSSLSDSGSTPVSGQVERSPCISFDTSQCSPPSTSGVKCLFNSGNQRRSKRLETKKVQRMELGKMGCFSPKISRKEMVRRSLRLRFSLGRNSRDTVLNRHLSNSGSENIGWRLASQWESEKAAEPRKKEATFSPNQDERFTKDGAENISRSQENLLTPESTLSENNQISWSGPSPVELQEFNDQEGAWGMGYLHVRNHFLEPALGTGKYPAVPTNLKCSTINNCEEGQAETLNGDENVTETTLLKIQKAFSESGSNLHTLINEAKHSAVPSSEEKLAGMICKQESELEKNMVVTSINVAEANDFSKKSLQKSCSTKDSSHKTTASLVKEVEFQGKPECEYHVEQLQEEKVSEDLQRGQLVCAEQESLFIHLSKAKINKPDHHRQIKVVKLEPSTEHLGEVMSSTLNPLTSEISDVTVRAQPTCALPNVSKTENVHVFKECSLEPVSVKHKPKIIDTASHVKVSNHIQWFNKISLNNLSSGTGPAPSSKFPNTPVCQSVRRINSFCEVKRQVPGSTVVKPVGSIHLVKSVSCDGMHSFCTEAVSLDTVPLLACSKVVAKQVATSHKHLKKSCDQFIDPFEHLDSENAKADKLKARLSNQSGSALSDVTNQGLPKATGESLVRQKSSLKRIPAKEKCRFKGSPKNPIAKARFQPASKPLEL
ncbi:rho GTPase-activating protein 11A [Microcaecilia unicolor]|uniref:Rho GTPase-activating protein 11A n=1 Tax=Microcaecilia unicolor TaxID=1415580 RepID=A0A6P7Z617_9AMPH|nr:rho GTPase-activating protein 11A [Microcaecilia unicolor]XP_030070851.1 rho GTPase-activating protein 11A [Microcaecilia unicolor]